MTRDAAARVSERRSSVQPFTLHGVTFECWITADGQHLEWRSTCGRFAVGRDGAEHWAKARGRIIGTRFASLKLAMDAAIQNTERAVA